MTKSLGNFVTPKKFLALQNFVGIFQKFQDFFSSNSEKNIIFRGRFSRKILLNDYDFWQFSINPWYVKVFGKLSNLKKMSFKGLEKRSRSFFSGCRYIEILRFSMSAIIYYQNPCKLPVTLYIKAYKPLKSLVPNPDMCKMRQKIIASMP